MMNLKSHPAKALVLLKTILTITHKATTNVRGTFQGTVSSDRRWNFELFSKILSSILCFLPPNVPPPQPLGKNLSFLEDPRTFEGRVSARGLRRFRKAHLEIFYRGDPEIATPGTPRGSQGTKKIFWKIFSWKVIRVYVGRFRGYYGKRVIFRPKTVILKCLCYHSPTYSFLVKNHFFTTITPKPAYMYPNNISRENFSK